MNKPERESEGSSAMSTSSRADDETSSDGEPRGRCDTDGVDKKRKEEDYQREEN